MKVILTLLVFTLVLVSCKSTLNLAKKVPACVEDQIKNALNNPAQNPPLEVWEWKDNSNTYYYFTAPCCDQFTTLYDTQCNKICAPDGGFTGKGDGKCPEFSGEIEKTLIWKDDREKSSNPPKGGSVPKKKAETE